MYKIQVNMPPDLEECVTSDLVILSFEVSQSLVIRETNISENLRKKLINISKPWKNKTN